MTDDVSHDKRALRAELRERRRICTAKEREEFNTGVTANLIELAQRLGSTSIAAYLSTTDEPETRGFLRWACDHDITVLLPISRADGLLDWAPYDGEEEDKDLIGMPAPTSEVLGPIAINDVDLIIVPAASVDHSGMRMGWGRGYFDKTLGSMETKPPVYAVIFDNEYVAEVPTEIHDQPVDGIVTPSGIVTITEHN
ncbi:5-formyltetrahydrofolate cyclo-ligase [Salinibacterium amurskyense]|uniref:5-formyltetrahydrofolate cyclo-ligase n=1 Tax=Salinibacterium amurskyense TaxID=205941 RepID=A0A2M9D7W2_9MICO|nr:5-formyltetrahydrofolate cyclo-ligase [Salinibacterium amurskyense]PJJ81762.1 5-formyltetrahydrofolate cyclo-ligase [Salinibacterium amurskyense]RLQ83737.1 5-formyltetrahydrofolate cyclo-ligase [Salinibacterium amurskyense]GHD79358.1 5-formyltetrahydrofolate cyclo-ligase [Salinibacterium amurskyense]